MEKLDKAILMDQYEYGVKRLERFNRYLDNLRPWIDESKYQIDGKIKNCIKKLASGKRAPEELLLDCLCDNNICHLRDADIEYIDRKALRIMFDEILIDEEYYFEYDSDKPFILDCGTNIGISLYYFKMYYPNARIIGFEPWKTAFDVVQRNIECNKWKDVTVYPFALADKDCDTVFNVPKKNSLAGTVTNRCFESKETDFEAMTVNCRRLSSFIETPIDFIKMDIEGVERQVLYDIAEYLPEIRYIFCEYHFGNSIRNNSLAEILYILENKGFDYAVNFSNRFQSWSKRPLGKIGNMVSMVVYAKNRKFIKL